MQCLPLTLLYIAPTTHLLAQINKVQVIVLLQPTQLFAEYLNIYSIWYVHIFTQ